jgi:signal transduction histidine kinase
LAAVLPALAEQMRAAGLSTTLRIEGERAPGGESVNLTAYRIIQEALTNTVKHAQASRADICLRYRPDAIDVSVSDDGRGCTGPAGDACAAHGQIPLLTTHRRRVAAQPTRAIRPPDDRQSARPGGNRPGTPHPG